MGNATEAFRQAANMQYWRAHNAPAGDSSGEPEVLLKNMRAELNEVFDRYVRAQNGLETNDRPRATSTSGSDASMGRDSNSDDSESTVASTAPTRTPRLKSKSLEKASLNTIPEMDVGVAHAEPTCLDNALCLANMVLEKHEPTRELEEALAYIIAASQVNIPVERLGKLATHSQLPHMKYIAGVMNAAQQPTQRTHIYLGKYDDITALTIPPPLPTMKELWKLVQIDLAMQAWQDVKREESRLRESQALLERNAELAHRRTAATVDDVTISAIETLQIGQKMVGDSSWRAELFGEMALACHDLVSDARAKALQSMEQQEPVLDEERCFECAESGCCYSNHLHGWPNESVPLLAEDFGVQPPVIQRTEEAVSFGYEKSTGSHGTTQTQPPWASPFLDSLAWFNEGPYANYQEVADQYLERYKGSRAVESVEDLWAMDPWATSFLEDIEWLNEDAYDSDHDETRTGLLEDLNWFDEDADISERTEAQTVQEQHNRLTRLASVFLSDKSRALYVSDSELRLLHHLKVEQATSRTEDKNSKGLSIRGGACSTNDDLPHGGYPPAYPIYYPPHYPPTQPKPTTPRPCPGRRAPRTSASNGVPKGLSPPSKFNFTSTHDFLSNVEDAETHNEDIEFIDESDAPSFADDDTKSIKTAIYIQEMEVEVGQAEEILSRASLETLHPAGTSESRVEPVNKEAFINNFVDEQARVVLKLNFISKGLKWPSFQNFLALQQAPIMSEAQSFVTRLATSGFTSPSSRSLAKSMASGWVKLGSDDDDTVLGVATPSWGSKETYQAACNSDTTEHRLRLRPSHRCRLHTCSFIAQGRKGIRTHMMQMHWRRGRNASGPQSDDVACGGAKKQVLTVADASIQGPEHGVHSHPARFSPYLVCHSVRCAHVAQSEYGLAVHIKAKHDREDLLVYESGESMLSVVEETTEQRGPTASSKSLNHLSPSLGEGDERQEQSLRKQGLYYCTEMGSGEACTFVGQRWIDLRQHLVDVHYWPKEVAGLRGGGLHEQTAGLPSFSQHNYASMEEDMVTCDVCGWQTPNQAWLDFHVSTEHYVPSDETGPRHTDIRRLVQQEGHGTDENLVLCGLCGWQTTTQARLDLHVSIKHPLWRGESNSNVTNRRKVVQHMGEDELFICFDCGAQFECEDDLGAHKSKGHEWTTGMDEFRAPCRNGLMEGEDEQMLFLRGGPFEGPNRGTTTPNQTRCDTTTQRIEHRQIETYLELDDILLRLDPDRLLRDDVSEAETVIQGTIPALDTSYYADVESLHDLHAGDEEAVPALEEDQESDVEEGGIVDKEQQFRCGVGSYVATDAQELVVHEAVEHDWGCNDCGFRATSEGLVAKHEAATHVKTVFPCTTPACNLTSHETSAALHASCEREPFFKGNKPTCKWMNSMKKRDAYGSEKPLWCMVMDCRFRFNKVQNLKGHIRCHKMEREVQKVVDGEREVIGYPLPKNHGERKLERQLNAMKRKRGRDRRLRKSDREMQVSRFSR